MSGVIQKFELLAAQLKTNHFHIVMCNMHIIHTINFLILYILTHLSTPGMSTGISLLRFNQQAKKNPIEILFPNSHADLFILQYGLLNNASYSVFINELVILTPPNTVRTIHKYTYLCEVRNNPYPCTTNEQKRQNLWKVQKQSSGCIHAYAHYPPHQASFQFVHPNFDRILLTWSFKMSDFYWAIQGTRLLHFMSH